MRLTLIVLIAATCAGSGGPVKVREAAAGSYATVTSRTAAFALDESTYAARWQQLIGRGEAPKIDFTREAAVFVLGGQKPTGGYSVEVRGAKLAGETLVIDAVVKSPPPDAMVTQALTSPYAVVAVDQRGFRDVRWTP